jgi:hypothetical protein
VSYIIEKEDGVVACSSNLEKLSRDSEARREAAALAIRGLTESTKKITGVTFAEAWASTRKEFPWLFQMD